MRKIHRLPATKQSTLDVSNWLTSDGQNLMQKLYEKIQVSLEKGVKFGCLNHWNIKCSRLIRFCFIFRVTATAFFNKNFELLLLDGTAKCLNFSIISSVTETGAGDPDCLSVLELNKHVLLVFAISGLIGFLAIEIFFPDSRTFS